LKQTKKISGLMSGDRGSQFLVMTTLVFCALGAGGSAAQENDFLRSEFLVLGAQASTTWQSSGLNTYLASGQIGGEGLDKPREIGSTAKPEEKKQEAAGPANTGQKVKAGVLSAVFPGVGQYYNGDHKKAYIMGGIEVAIWTTYFVFDTQGDNRLETSIEYAGIYAGTSGSHPDSYWQSVGRYMDSDAYNEAVLREARALQEEPGGLVSGRDTWQWVNEDRKDGFGKLRADANSAYDRRDFMILFAVVNRAVSVVDAVMGAGKVDGILETEVLGMNLGFEMLPSYHDPGAQCVISRRF
jgi:hypothetical protein